MNLPRKSNAALSLRGANEWTEEISLLARQALAHLYDEVIDVEKIFVPHARVGKRPYLPYVFTRLHALRLGRDGDLGHSYDKIALLDADLLPLRHYDHLFTLPAPAGTSNERKTNVMEWGEDGNFIIPDSVAQDGTWHWHQIYADCPHGQPIPREITDRVASDPSNMGVISSLLLLEPSLAEFNAIMQDIQSPEMQSLVSDAFDWPEMQYLTLRYSGRWTNVDLRFHSLNGYPNLDVLTGIHYPGFKPWQFRREGSMERYGRRDDFTLVVEVFSREAALGFLAWAVASLATAALLTSAIGSILSGGIQAGASVVGGAATTATLATSGLAAAGKMGAEDSGPLAYFIDALFRRDASAVAPHATRAATAAEASERTMVKDAAEVSRIFTNVSRAVPLPPEDIRYVGQLVARRTGLSQHDAEKRVTDIYARAQATLNEAEAAARDATDTARKASAYAALWIFVSLLSGAFVASVAATIGGRQRDA